MRISREPTGINSLFLSRLAAVAVLAVGGAHMENHRHNEGIFDAISESIQRNGSPLTGKNKPSVCKGPVRSDPVIMTNGNSLYQEQIIPVMLSNINVGILKTSVLVVKSSRPLDRLLNGGVASFAQSKFTTYPDVVLSSEEKQEISRIKLTEEGKLYNPSRALISMGEIAIKYCGNINQNPPSPTPAPSDQGVVLALTLKSGPQNA